MATRREVKVVERAGRPAGLLVERGVALVGLVVVAVAAAVVLLASLGVVDPLAVPWIGAPLAGVLGFDHEELWLAHRVGAGTGSLVVGLLAVWLALGRVFRGEDDTGTILLDAGETGVVMVDARSVSIVAAEPVLRIPGVLDAEVQVRGAGAGPIRLRVTAWVMPAADLRKIGEEATRLAPEAVRRLVGLDVQAVVVNLHVVPARDVGRTLR